MLVGDELYIATKKVPYRLWNANIKWIKVQTIFVKSAFKIVALVVAVVDT